MSSLPAAPHPATATTRTQVLQNSVGDQPQHARAASATRETPTPPQAGPANATAPRSRHVYTALLRRLTADLQRDLTPSNSAENTNESFSNGSMLLRGDQHHETRATTSIAPLRSTSPTTTSALDADGNPTTRPRSSVSSTSSTTSSNTSETGIQPDHDQNNRNQQHQQHQQYTATTSSTTAQPHFAWFQDRRPASRIPSVSRRVVSPTATTTATTATHTTSQSVPNPVSEPADRLAIARGEGTDWRTRAASQTRIISTSTAHDGQQPSASPSRRLQQAETITGRTVITAQTSQNDAQQQQPLQSRRRYVRHSPPQQQQQQQQQQQEQQSAMQSVLHSQYGASAEQYNAMSGGAAVTSTALTVPSSSSSAYDATGLLELLLAMGMLSPRFQDTTATGGTLGMNPYISLWRRGSPQGGLDDPSQASSPFHLQPSVLFRPGSSARTSPASSPRFRSKAVCILNCKACTRQVCERGMRAILLADNKVELFSTDEEPRGVSIVGDEYTTGQCACKVRDIACLGCGNVIGYHVTSPCLSCIRACNNGHFWMFHMDGVAHHEVIDNRHGEKLLWSELVTNRSTEDTVLVDR